MFLRSDFFFFQEGASENEAKVSELTTAVIELQKHLKQASEGVGSKQ